jgi:acyl-coenzyme A thioesterase PaaI-like protein
VRRVDPATLAAVRAEFGHCFGCGPDNPIGLQIDRFECDDTSVRAWFTPRVDYRGFHGILHGGIVATALDEILAWTAILVGGSAAVTAKLDLRFRSPSPADAEYELIGRLVEHRGRRFVLEGECRVDGSVVADASGLFLTTAARGRD